MIFGRTDSPDSTLYIGRRRVYDEHKDLKVVTWHTPAAAPFYEASNDDPCGLILKRTFIEEERRFVRLIDEIFGAAETALGGPTVSDALLSGFRGRATEPCATSSPPSRLSSSASSAPRWTSLLSSSKVDPGPARPLSDFTAQRGSRTTTSHFASEGRSLAPSATLPAYISGVLPLLGVNDVLQVQLPDLYAGDGRATAQDGPLADAVKGSERMAQVLANALRQRTGGAPGHLEPCGGRRPRPPLSRCGHGPGGRREVPSLASQRGPSGPTPDAGTGTARCVRK